MALGCTTVPVLTKNMKAVHHQQTQEKTVKKLIIGSTKRQAFLNMIPEAVERTLTETPIFRKLQQMQQK